MGVKPYSYSDRHPGGDARPMIGDGMQVRQGFRALTAMALTGAMLAAGIVRPRPAQRAGGDEQRPG